MKKNIEQYFRVECNFGCKYFTNPDKAKAYFDRKADKHLDVEMWLVTYCRFSVNFVKAAAYEHKPIENTKSAAVLTDIYAVLCERQRAKFYH